MSNLEVGLKVFAVTLWRFDSQLQAGIEGAWVGGVLVLSIILSGL